MTINDIDLLLMRLAQAPLPASLASIDQGVLSRVTADAAYRAHRKLGIATISAALVLGMAGAAMQSRDAAATSFAALSSISPLSPAALLGGGR